MALTELTKVTGPGIHTLSNVLSHNIKSSGIITATKFSGPLDSIGGNFAGVITATSANFTGNVSIGGTLTYEDVTNIDSVGIITARDGLKVLGGGANIVGVVTATTFKGNGDFVELDVDGHTNLDNVSIAGITTYSKSGSALRLNDGSILRLGNADADFFLYHDGNNIDYISAGASKQLRLTTDDFIIKGANNTETLMTAAKDGAVTLYHNNIPRLSTSSVGVSIPQDLDVDGHTNLDNVSVAGVSTITGVSDHSSRLQMLAGNPIRLLNDGNSAHCEIDCYGGAGFRITSYNQTMFTCENGNNTKFYTAVSYTYLTLPTSDLV